MDFKEIAITRQSCRKFDETRQVEQEKLDAIINTARLAPSACNGQPYFITVCTGDKAKKVAKQTMSMGLNGFTISAPVQIVISEEPYVKTALVGSKLKGNDYRSMDIGIVASYITCEATAQGLGSCMLGWFSDKEIRKICNVNGAVRLVISIGYPRADDKQRAKKRKDMEKLVKYI